MPTPTIPLSKPGKHGTLNLYRVTWTDCPNACDSGEWPPTQSSVYGYDAEHAHGIVTDWQEDEGFRILSVVRA